MTKTYTKSYDVVMVGGGHNGLICATYLAKSGRRVVVLEANDQLGGAAATREFSPGFSVSACAQWMYGLHPDIVKDLKLKKYGLQYAARNLHSIALDKKGSHVTIALGGVEGVSADDQAAYVEFRRKMGKYSQLLGKLFDVRPPKIIDGNLTDRLNLLKIGLGVKLLGKDDMYELLRLGLINMFDVMEETFDSELLKALVSFDGVLGAHMGPRSPGTVYGYLYRHMSDVYGFNGPALVKGGMGGVGEALSAAAKDAGVEIRTNTAVKSINIDHATDRATGVTLENGETLMGVITVSNADVKTTMNGLVGNQNLETETVRRVENFRTKASSAKLHLALDSLPKFNGLSSSLLGQRLVIAPDMHHIERAFNFAKYGEYSEAPVLDISIASVHDDSLAPRGKHVLSAIVQFAPGNLEAGWSEQNKKAFKQLCIDTIEQYAPGLKNKIIASELLTPADLAEEFNMTDGHWHHGDISLDQVATMRPFPGAEQYATPVDGLYLCGASAHPGGNVFGLPGRNAAKQIIKRGGGA